MLAPLILALAVLGATPLEVVKSGNTEVQKIAAAADAAEKLAARADEFVDFGELAKRALGKDWPKLSKPQQDDFAQTMKVLLRASYASKASAEGKGKLATEYGAEQITGNEAVVGTMLVMNNDRFPVDYKLYRRDEKGPWKIYDVVTDSVSLVAAYQDQFRTLINTKGIDGLINTLKSKRQKLEAKDAAAKQAATTVGVK
ncbi:MAG: ABC-type transport system involved in resistance to organic solvent, auxiliary component [Myxococcaceae bacterium]|nr:ABC-type transport system involved in resistance to organic solvent, auxiliary component [Myxococcaceae bacterium]